MSASANRSVAALSAYKPGKGELVGGQLAMLRALRPGQYMVDLRHLSVSAPLVRTKQ
jgi:hypothetical protein